VLLVDDQEMVRHSLAISLALFDDLQLVGRASNGIEAIHLRLNTHMAWS
jgi:DNA-binding NarL/FixJ family response regulator